MKLYRLLIVNMLIWGVPSIPTYFLYEISRPFVMNSNNFVGQLFGVVGMFILLLIANWMIFWDKYYDVYLREPDKPKQSEKITEKINKKLI